MRKWLEKLENIVDKSVPIALLAVLGIVILELFFTETAHHYDVWINGLDTAVIGIFAVDLSFKYSRAKTKEGFLRNHWLEVIAIMPFFYFFRFMELIRIASSAEIGQEAAHLAEGARSGRFAEFFRSSRLAQSSRLGKLVRFSSRAPRFAKAAEFFDHPNDH